MKKKHRLKGLGFYVFLFFLILIVLASSVYPGNISKNRVYSDLVREIKYGNVKKIAIFDNKVIASLNDNTLMEVNIPSINALYFDVGSEIKNQIVEGKLNFEIPEPSVFSWIWSFLPTLGFLIISFAMLLTFFQGGNNGRNVLSFGKSRARLSDNKKRITFTDVAGANEEKYELEEIIDFLKRPQKYIGLGARIPKGTLLIGQPGTGKTLLAKAVAGEANVPFFSISGSDFVEMFVGVGASRVRDLFEQAKKKTPCIIFIDEIDAVGRHRGAGLGGGHDEREQTLNQLLVEMDGFSNNERIIIIAATNRPDILDPALLRPGRFDRKITLTLPDIKGRREILEIHSKNKPLEKNVKLETIAKTTVGFTGADLENVMNEAALIAARLDKNKVEMPHVEEAIIKVIAGPEKRSKVVIEREKKLTAYHESGHAIITKLMPTLDDVHQISIISRGMAGGYTLSLPKEDECYTTKLKMIEKIKSLLGGMCAEEMIFNDVSTGASSDLQRATKIARNMITKYGMSAVIGAMTLESEQEIFVGRDYGHSKNYSEEFASKVDNEIKRIIDTSYEECKKLLKNNLEILHKVAQKLIEKEKMDASEFESMFKESNDKLEIPKKPESTSN